MKRRMLYYSGSGQVSGCVGAANLRVKSAIGDAVNVEILQPEI
jgi:hypothetical protein